MSFLQDQNSHSGAHAEMSDEAFRRDIDRDFYLVSQHELYLGAIGTKWFSGTLKHFLPVSMSGHRSACLPYEEDGAGAHFSFTYVVD